MKYTVILEPQEEGGYTVRCLELPGAISQGETKEEALKNIKEAIELVLAVLNQELASRSNVEVLKVELADVGSSSR
jgi:predicted RNase H-like HicB family nuclease